MSSAAVRVLAAIERAAKACGAYEIADHLRAAAGEPVHPTLVYRGLAKLLEARLIVRVHSLSAYVLSPDPDNELWLALVCSECRSVTLIDSSSSRKPIENLSAVTGFTPSEYCLECHGVCRNCELRQDNTPMYVQT